MHYGIVNKNGDYVVIGFDTDSEDEELEYKNFKDDINKAIEYCNRKNTETDLYNWLELKMVWLTIYAKAKFPSIDIDYVRQLVGEIDFGDVEVELRV